jgi:methylated-DNA-[protein]-cysteine S-methyltransferase
MNHHASIPSPIGDLLVIADHTAVRGLYFPGHWFAPPTGDALGEATAIGDDPVLQQTARELDEYFAGSRTRFDVPVAFSGSETSERIWRRLQEIPYGTTTTYGVIARELGDRNLAQRVGQAVGHNPISIIIPCHRVIGADGSMTGFAGGLERKRHLLALEEPDAAAADRLF